MPRAGSQVVLCNLPVRFDTYVGCSHACAYCFAKRKQDISAIDKGESAVALRNFIKGDRNMEIKWLDWDIPLHWGELSDPFQPAELTHRVSFDCLKVFAETGYPVVLSTKAVMPFLNEEYRPLINGCNMALQVSMMSPVYDKHEPGAPSFNQRLSALEHAVKITRRVLIRLQPYTLAAHDDILNTMKAYADLGVHGVIIEGMKRRTKKKGLVQLEADWCYPIETLLPRFSEIKESAHANGMKFYSGENRLRNMGDSLTCCGVEDMDGFKVFKGNLNQFLFDPDNYVFTPGADIPGSAYTFKSLDQTTISSKMFQKMTFREVMDLYVNDKTKQRLMGR